MKLIRFGYLKSLLTWFHTDNPKIYQALS